MRPEASLASIIDPMPAARELAQSLTLDCYPSFKGIAPEQRPEGIVVATPNTMHVANGLECIGAGIAVLIESRLRMTSSAPRHRSIQPSGMMNRYSSAIIAAAAR